MTIVNSLRTALRRPFGILPKRVAAHILIASSIVTFVLTSWQLNTEWKKGIQKRSTGLSHIDVSFVPQLSSALWSLDTDQINLIVEGIMSATGASYLTIEDVSNRPPIVHGQLVTGHKLERSYLLKTTAGEEEKNVGTMLVQIELDSFYKELWNRLWHILIGQTIKTFLVSFAIMMIIAHLITRHLVAIAEAADRSSKQLTEHTPIQLDRQPSKKPDELDKLVSALNTLNISNKEFLLQLKSKNEERQAMQEELINAAQRASVSQTITGVLHDVNNFLSIVFGYIPILQTYISDANTYLPIAQQQKIADVIDKVTKSTDAAHQVANLHLRTFSLSSQATIIEVDMLVDSVLWIQDKFFSNNKIEVIYPQPKGLRIFAMQGIIATILINLLKNAVESFKLPGFVSGGPAKITISSQMIVEERAVTIAITDNGPGINETNFGQLFDEGFTTKKEGHGIGLHFCRNLALRSGGNLTVASSGTGTGATFFLTLPSEDPAQTPISS